MTDEMIFRIFEGSFTAIIAIYVAKIKSQNTQQSKDICEVHIAVNSRMTELLELTRRSSKAEGKKEEKQETAVTLNENNQKTT